MKIVKKVGLWLAILIGGFALYGISEYRIKPGATAASLCEASENCIRALTIGKEGGRIAYSVDGRYLFGSGETARRWDVAASYNAKKLSRLGGLALGTDGQYAAIFDNDIKLFDAEGNELLEFSPSSEGITDARQLAFIPDYTMLAVVGSTEVRGENKLAFWSTRTGEFRTTLPHDGYVEGITASKHGVLAVSLDSGKVVLWPLADLAGQLVLEIGDSSPFTELAFSEDGEVLATSATDGEIKLWKVSTGQLVTTLTQGNETVSGLAFLPDGSLLAADWSGLVALWNTDTGELVKSWEYGRRVSQVALSPDGQHLAVSLVGEVREVAERRDTRTRTSVIRDSNTNSTYTTGRTFTESEADVILVTDISQFAD